MNRSARAIATVEDRNALATVQQSARALATSQERLLQKADALMLNAEQFYEKFRDSGNARDVKAALDACNQSLRLIAELQGAFPKAVPQTTIDNRSITLNGLSREDLHILIAGLKAQQV